MKPIRNVYLAGLGAVGGAYGSKLYEMDPHCIKIIADKQRIERYLKNGIVINGKAYPFEYIQPEEASNTADLIIVAVKQHHLDQVIKDIRHFIGTDTIILSLLNGITSEEILGKEYGMEKILYSFCVGTDSVREETKIQFSSIGKIVFGEKTNYTISPKVAAVKELFEAAKIPYSIPDNMMRELWWKFMVNVGINQISAILKAPYGIFQNVKEAKELMDAASKEVIELSVKAGINLCEDDIMAFTKILQTLSPNGKTSMLQDVEAGRKTEVEIFAGAVIELGRKYGIATPVNEMLFRMIRTIEQF
jgi:2-dehydropantoate 2-reductase